MKQEIRQALKNLSSDTDAFFSEDHFKLEFAIELDALLNEPKREFDIIPEFPYDAKSAAGQDVHMIFDLMIIEKSSGNRAAIEFKYKTKEQKNLKVLKAYAYQPKSQRGLIPGRFDCWSDIERLEYEKEQGYLAEGYFIFVTNDSAYYQAGGSTPGSSQSGSFSLESGKHVHEIKTLPTNAPKNTWGNRRIDHSLRFPNGAKGILIKGDYDFQYDPFGQAGFKSLLVEVK